MSSISFCGGVPMSTSHRYMESFCWSSAVTWPVSWPAGAAWPGVVVLPPAPCFFFLTSSFSSLTRPPTAAVKLAGAKPRCVTLFTTW